MKGEGNERKDDVFRAFRPGTYSTFHSFKVLSLSSAPAIALFGLSLILVRFTISEMKK